MAIQPPQHEDDEHTVDDVLLVLHHLVVKAGGQYGGQYPAAIQRGMGMRLNTARLMFKRHMMKICAIAKRW